MRHQFKPGDLALVIRHENAGRTVTLVQQYLGPTIYRNEHGYQVIPPGVVAWEIEADSLITTRTSSGREVLVGKLAIGEKCLMPLRGDFAPEQQKAKEAEPCA
ncbi:hypothetical protein [Pseudomonas fulva]|uniref:hypothetical protein n=1 Tax=Pseudomonas fulva TaxID=47880 RepID=UPI003F92A108